MVVSQTKTTTKRRTGRRPKDVEEGTFGWELREARKKREIEPNEFADMLNVKRPSVVRWERNTTLPTPQVLDQINNILGTNFTRLPRTHASKGKTKTSTVALLKLLAERIIAALVAEGFIVVSSTEAKKRLDHFTNKRLPLILRKTEKP